MSDTPDQPRYFAGLSLGEPQDFAALAVLEKTKVPAPAREGKTLGHYAVRHLERFSPGTPYPDVAARLAGLFASPPLESSVLVLDRTLVGNPVLRLFHRAKIQARFRPLTVTLGHRASPAEAGGYSVPKMDLIGGLQ